MPHEQANSIPMHLKIRLWSKLAPNFSQICCYMYSLGYVLAISWDSCLFCLLHSLRTVSDVWIPKWKTIATLIESSAENQRCYYRSLSLHWLHLLVILSLSTKRRFSVLTLRRSKPLFSDTGICLMQDLYSTGKGLDSLYTPLSDPHISMIIFASLVSWYWHCSKTIIVKHISSKSSERHGLHILRILDEIFQVHRL